MNRTYVIYWRMIQSGELRTQTKEPARKPWVREEERTDEQDQTTTYHTFYSSTGATQLMTGRCGYDRGPKRKDIIRRLLSL